MRILSFSRDEGGCNGSAKIQLTEGEVRALCNILYKKDDHDGGITQNLNKDFFVLRELMHHGGFDRPAIRILCRTAKIEKKEGKNEA